MKLSTMFRGGCWLAVLWLWAAVPALAETTNDLSAAELEGRQLARQLYGAQPTANFTNSPLVVLPVRTGILDIRSGNGLRSKIPVTCKTAVTPGYWEQIYVYKSDLTNYVALIVIHPPTGTNTYYCFTNQVEPTFMIGDLPVADFVLHKFYSGYYSGAELMMPFAGSDFWLGDLGLDFLHWPAQKVLPKKTTLKRGREYTLLESTNPDPPTNGYSRVLSWIDKETGGILEAEAYDVKGKLLKDFAPKEFSKVNGQWELQEIEMRNVQTGSRTRLEFDLKK